MDDQRIDGRPILGGEDSGNRVIVAGIGAQAIDRLGGEGDELAALSAAAAAAMLAPSLPARSAHWGCHWPIAAGDEIRIFETRLAIDAAACRRASSTWPPAAASTAWPAAVSHSMVRPKRG